MQNNQAIVINLFFLKFLGKYLMKVKNKYVLWKQNIFLLRIVTWITKNSISL